MAAGAGPKATLPVLRSPVSASFDSLHLQKTVTTPCMVSRGTPSPLAITVGVRMARKRKARIEHTEVVRLFAARLREVRRSRGTTQAELAREAHVTPSYIWRLESGGAAPGIDLVDRLARALGTTAHDLMPLAAAPDTELHLREQAHRLFESLVNAADRETLLMLVPLLARLGESPSRNR